MTQTRHWLRLTILILMAGTLAVSACGKKGDPERPGTETEEEQSTS